MSDRFRLTAFVGLENCAIQPVLGSVHINGKWKVRLWNCEVLWEADGIYERFECIKLVFVPFKLVLGAFLEERVEGICRYRKVLHESSV